MEYSVFQGGGGFAQELSTYVLPEARTALGDVRDWKLVPAADLVTDTAAGGNGLPDEWENFYGLSSGPGGDDDGDGLDNAGELAQLSDPTVVDTDGDGLDDAAESVFGSDPLLADSDGDGLTDPVEQAAGTDPNLADSDSDGYSDPQELAAGTSPTLGTEVPDTYAQTFDSFSDGTTSFLDGTSLSSNKGQASVQGGMLRLLEDNNGSTTAPVPAAAAGGIRTTAVRVLRLRDERGPGRLGPGPRVQPELRADRQQRRGRQRRGRLPGRSNRRICSTTTYAGGGNQGQRIYEQVSGAYSEIATNSGVVLDNGQTAHGRFTASFDSAWAKLVDFSTTGMVTDAAFDDIVSAITA